MKKEAKKAAVKPFSMFKGSKGPKYNIAGQLQSNGSLTVRYIYFDIFSIFRKKGSQGPKKVVSGKWKMFFYGLKDPKGYFRDLI